MGFKLRREVRDHLPAGLLTGGERCLVLELADWCNDDTREGWPGVEWLAVAADVPESKVGEMFARIARKWVELRVPLGVGKDGRPFFARSGHRTIYRFPNLTTPPNEATQNGGPSRIEAPQNGVPEGTQIRGAEAPQNGGARYPILGGPSPQGSPQRTTSSPPSGEAAPRAPLVDGPEEEEGSEEDQRSRLADRVQQIRPAWGRRSILKAMTDALNDRRPWPAIARALVLVAEDPDTQAPGRLNADGPWWNEPEPAKPPKPPWCGRCESASHRHVQREDPYGGGIKMVRCPDCNPLVVAPAQLTAAEIGEIMDRRYAAADRKRHRPFRNPEPDAYHQPL